MNLVKNDQPETVPRNDMKHAPFVLAHLSDPHLFSPSGVRVSDLLNKRIYGYLSWHLRRHREHRGEILAAMLKDVRAAKPDHIALTGDLTHLGLPSEFREARELLRSLGPPSQVTVIPGNHDAYVATSLRGPVRFWSEYMASDPDLGSRKGEATSGTVFPLLRIRGSVAVIGVSTAHPSGPFLAVGSVGREQLEKLEDVLAETGRRRLFRVVLIHHPPVRGAVSWRKRLTDYRAFQLLVVRCGAELILHGHTHRTFEGHVETPRGKVSCFGTPSASALGRTAWRRARYHLFRLVGKENRLELFLSVRVYSPRQKQFVEEGERQVFLPQTSG
jgi:3',5'-cyclic AMP phosphodiesterase CpdA